MGGKARISQTLDPQATRLSAHIWGLHPLSRSRLAPHAPNVEVDHLLLTARLAAPSQELGTSLGTQLAVEGEHAGKASGVYSLPRIPQLEPSPTVGSWNLGYPAEGL